MSAYKSTLVKSLISALLILSLCSAIVTSKPVFERDVLKRGLDKRYLGEVCYADFENDGDVKKCSGRFTFTQITETTVRVLGQFNTGFPDAVLSNYEFHVHDAKDSPLKDITKEIRAKVAINPPGTSAFQCDVDGLDVDTIVGCYFIVKKRDNVVIGKAKIQKV
ncbi:4050_t:CDS:1 [Acaulospora morrowiae]|uniref:4050_t:CDS:1 n=1 Tax=Acaulospora morrowiae TaxID=94023 RepID=A0A9N9GMC2_9GLOM|nr:4050_t:CDS:1 [Acaulospora morrowiae]